MYLPDTVENRCAHHPEEAAGDCGGPSAHSRVGREEERMVEKGLLAPARCVRHPGNRSYSDWEEQSESATEPERNTY